jgi:hypothetical protein
MVVACSTSAPVPRDDWASSTRASVRRRSAVIRSWFRESSPVDHQRCSVPRKAASADPERLRALALDGVRAMGGDGERRQRAGDRVQRAGRGADRQLNAAARGVRGHGGADSIRGVSAEGATAAVSRPDGHGAVSLGSTNANPPVRRDNKAADPLLDWFRVEQTEHSVRQRPTTRSREAQQEDPGMGARLEANERQRSPDPA